MTNVPTQRSPILLFEQQIAGAAFTIAPEREQHLQASAPRFSLALSNDKGFYIRVNMVTHEATLPVATLEYLWTCAHLGWVLYQEYTAAQQRGEGQLDLSTRRNICDAIDVFNWARNNHAASGIPTINRSYTLQQEQEADQMATDWILGECTDPQQRKKRQPGMVTALLAMQLLDEPPGANTYAGTHPPTVERIHACLDHADVDDDGAPRALAALVLQLQLAQLDLAMALDGSSIGDILADALVTFRTARRTA